MKTHHVPFAPYESHQISRLLQQRLAVLPGPAFDPKALEMCARKVGRNPIFCCYAVMLHSCPLYVPVVLWRCARKVDRTLLTFPIVLHTPCISQSHG